LQIAPDFVPDQPVPHHAAALGLVLPGLLGIELVFCLLMGTSSWPSFFLGQLGELALT
jgi:hypothetical protein